MRLTKYEVTRSHEGSGLGTGPVIQYGIHGLPPGDEALVANFGTRGRDDWRILRVKNGVQGHWTGNYASADQALSALQME